MKKSFGPKGNKTSLWSLQRRRHAVEQNNYDASSSSYSSFAEDFSDCSSFITPSLEFPDRISFRICEENEGETDQVLENLSEAGPSGTVENSQSKRLLTRIIASMKKSSGRRGDKTPVRRLERRDAARHINYDAAARHINYDAAARNINYDEASSSTALMTRSLELTSFGIGGGDGEINRSYRSLGVSGSDDLAISDDASKMRSSSHIDDIVKSFDLDDITELTRSIKNLTEVTRSIGNLTEVTRALGSLTEFSRSIGDLTEFTRSIGNLTEFTRSIGNLTEFTRSIGKLTELTRSESSEIGNLNTPVDEKKLGIEPTPNILVESKGDLVLNDAVAVGGGPPLVKPPPPMKLPPIEFQGSSWDFLKHFAPKSETNKRPSDNGYDDEEAGEEEVETEETGVRFLQTGDTGDEACSFTTNEGGSIITSWQKGQLLGRGSFGYVYEGISADGDFFAVKEVSLLDQDSQAQECIQQLQGEIALLSKLQHQNIVRYRGSARDESNLYIFLELVTQGSLLKLYQTYQRLQNSVVSGYTRQILDGLKYLHDNGFIHRDIKCANILVDANGAVKLADFGLAKVSKLNDIKSCKGTPFWMAPEIMNRKGNDGYGTPADIWSLGCTVLEMLTSQIPYGNLEPIQALFSIGRGTLPDIPDTLSLDARHFILKCLKVNPEERPTADELLNHPFVRRPLSSVGS